MIGIVTSGRRDGKSSIGSLVDYISSSHKLENDYDEVVGLWFANMAADTPNEAIEEIKSVAECNPKIRNNMMHMIVSWPAGEYPDKSMAEDTAHTILSRMGLADNQAVFSLHKNTDNYHLHIAVNRLDMDGKPVHAAGGWTKNAIQESCRKLELKYGLKIQHGGSVDVINGEVQYVDQRASVNKKARDFECFTGEESQERRLKKVCTEVFKSSPNWQSLHSKLNSLGIDLQKKGSGGVLQVNNIEVKLSRIHRDYTWSKLIARYGAFETPLAKHTDTENNATFQAPTPILETKSWDRYRDEKNKYYDAIKTFKSEKSVAYEKMRQKLADDSKKLSDRHKARRNALNEKPMSGQAKNMERRLLALKHAQERAVLKQRQAEEKASFRVKWLPTVPGGLNGRFPGFKEWLIKNGDPGEAEQWKFRRHLKEIMAFGDDSALDSNADSFLIKQREAANAILNLKTFIKNNAIYYYSKDVQIDTDLKSHLAFVDYGRKLTLHNEDDSNILACLQLAVSKWGKISVNGDSEFKQKCYAIALAHHISLNNPEFIELKQQIQELRHAQIEEAKPQPKHGQGDVAKTTDTQGTKGILPDKAHSAVNNEHIAQDTQDAHASKSAQGVSSDDNKAQTPHDVQGVQDLEAFQGDHKMTSTKSILDSFNKYHSAVQAERYRITVIRMLKDGTKKTMILDKNRETGETKGFTPEELRQRAGELERLVERGENIYYTPLSEKMHHILIDDMDMQKIERLVNDGHKACAIIESSPKNYQAIINIPKMNSPHDKDVANRLTKALNKKYGDQNLYGAIHPHRAPGSKNFKNKYMDSEGKFPEINLKKYAARTCEKTFEEAAKLNQAFADNVEKEKSKYQSQLLEHKKKGVSLPGTISPNAAYTAHADNIKQHFGSIDFSRLDAMVALRMRVTGYSEQEIARAISTEAPYSRGDDEKNKHTSWENYGARTAAYAFSGAGDTEARKWEHYESHWLKIEGRIAEQGEPSTKSGHKKPKSRLK